MKGPTNPTKAELARALSTGSSRSGRNSVETELVYSVIDYLRRVVGRRNTRKKPKGCRAFRRNVGAHAEVDDEGRRRFIRYGEAGQSDVWFVVPPYGVHGEIEVKAPGCEPTDLQDAWLQETREDGAIAFWCDSLRSCEQQLEAEWIKRGWLWRPEWKL